jgi:hypothetical protein
VLVAQAAWKSSRAQATLAMEKRGAPHSSKL